MDHTTVNRAHDQARALLTLAALAREGQITGARKAIERKAIDLLASGLLTSAGRANCNAALWGCREVA